MKLKKLNKVIALAVALVMAVPTTVFAAEPQEGTEMVLECETPEEYEARTGYQLPERYHYVLEDGYVLFLEDGSPWIEPDEEVEKPDESETPGESESPDESETPGESGKPGESETPEESENPEESESPKLPDDSLLPGTDDAEENNNSGMTNEELIANQEFYTVPELKEDFRFWTVARKYAFAKKELEIREDMSTDAENVGKLTKNGVCFILKEEDKWVYVESGRVRGFVLAEELVTGEDAQEILEDYQKEAKKKAKEDGEVYKGIEKVVPVAEELISYKENEAFTYLRATASQTVIEKEYALCTADLLNVREEKSTDARVVGELSQGSICYIIADREDEWVYIESADVRGFVKGEYLKTGEDAAAEIEENGEDTYKTAQEMIEPKDNGACYYTLTSVKSGVPGSKIRETVIDFASQFIGNPYVWGGTSLTGGADCSGFVQSIYREYGYELPRTAASQAQYGTKIKVEDAQPGDLIFYAKEGQIYHVVMYAGEGKTVEAMGKKQGIVHGNLNTKNAVWAVQVLDDTEDMEFTMAAGGGIGEVNATEAMYGECLGNFKLTHYCACELCCDVETGITATGAPVIEGRTIAVDPKVIPYGTKVIINGHIFTAEDCGGAIKGNRIDIYVNEHAKANALGVKYADVYLLK